MMEGKEQRKDMRTKVNTYHYYNHIELNAIIKLFILLICLISLSRCVSVEQKVCIGSVIVNNRACNHLDMTDRNRANE